MENLKFEVKFAADGTGSFEGYAATFDDVPDTYSDVIAKGAFTKSLADHRSAKTAPLLLWQHDTTEPIGVWTSIAEDDHGLAVKGRLVLETRRGAEAYALLKAGALNGLSIGYRTRASERTKDGGRILKDVELLEISLVSIPAIGRARVTGVKAALANGAATGAAKGRKDNPMTHENKAPANNAGNDVEARVAGLEESVSGIEARLASVEETVAGTAKAAARIEQKLNRPAINTGSDTPSPADLQRKAFMSFARKGVERMSPDEIKALTVATDASAGYLAPEAFATEIVKLLRQYSPIRQYAKVISIGSSEIKIPRRTGSPAAAWEGETDDRDESGPSYEQLTFTPHELATYTEVSNALLEDNAYSLESELASEFAESFGIAEGTAFVTGNGTGKPKGLLASGAISNEVKSGAAAAFATTNPADVLLDAFHKLPGVHAQNAVWMMNRTVLGTVRKWKDGQGRYLVVEPLTADAPVTLLGRPVVEAVDMPDVAANASPIIFGDLQGYRIVDRVSLSVLRDPYTVATKGLVRFHARKRVGADITHPDRFVRIKIAA